MLEPGYIWSDGTRNDKSYEWRINPCEIEIENKVCSKNYGEPDPIYNYEARVYTTSLDEEAKQRVLNEFNRIVKGSLSRDPGEEIGGTYYMQLGTLSGGRNFQLYLAGTGRKFSIYKAPAPAHVTVTREIIAGSGNITVRDLGGYMPYDDEVFRFSAKSKDQATITGTANITELSTINQRDVVLKYTGATAGTTISVPVDVKSNHYKDSTLTILYTVRDRNIIPVTVSQASITYGEKELPRVEFDWEGMTSSEKNNANVTYGGNTLKGGVYGPFTQINWGRLENSPKDAGNYIVSINYAPQGSDKSYEGSEAFRISPRTLSANDVRTGYTKVYTYDGTDQLPAQNELKVSAYIPRDKKYTELAAGEDYELYDGQTKRKDAGTYELLYKGKGNFKSGVLSAEWEIDRAVPGKLHFESVTETRTYNAQPQIVSAPDLKNSYTGAGRAAVLYEGTGDTVYEESSHAPSDAGTYRINLDLSEGDNFKAGKVEDVGTLTIKKASRGEVQAECFGQPGIEAGADLSAYIGKGGSLGNPEITDGSEYLVGGVRSEEGKILKFKFKEGAVSDNTVSVKIPVNGSVNYDTYNLVVTLTPEDHKHKFVRIPAVAPTCTTMGNIEYYTCEICGRSYLDETGAVLAGSVSLPIDPDAHDWGEWVVTKEPTKREAGQRKKECLRCHKTIVEEIPMVAVPSYSVAFSLNGKPGTAPAAQDILQGDPVAKPVDPSADGFIFLGWFTDTAGEDYFDFNTPVNSDLTLYAKWAAKDVKIFTVTFDLNGRSGTAPAAQKVAEGGMAGIPQNPAAEGFVFKGWYRDKDCKSLYDFADPVTADLTLYARWEEDVPPGAFKIFYTQSALAFDPYKGLTYNTENEHYEWTYTGSALKPVVTVTDYKGNVLSEGSDYTVKYSGNKDVSAKPAKVTVTGKGNYSGSKSLDFYILKADLGKAKAKKLLVVPDSFAVQKGKKLAATVIYRGSSLSAKNDYRLSNTGAIKEDTTVDIEGVGNNFTGKVSGIPVKALEAKEIKEKSIKVELKADKHVYSGSAQELSDKELAVAAGSPAKALTKGKDYRVVYGKNTDAGKAKVTVMALGDYVGTVSKTFNIDPDTKSAVTVTLRDGTSADYDPKGARPALVVKTDKLTLTAGKDYKVTYSDNKAKGEGSYKLTFLGNFKGHKAVTGKFAITEKSFASASINAADLIYKKPDKYRSTPFVSIGGVSVGKKDYTVKYFDGTKELGANDKITLGDGETERTITMKAAGRNNYKAEESAAFTYRVVKVSGNMINLSKAKIVAKGKTKGVGKQEYTGDYVTPEVDVLIKQGKTWVALDPANYTVAYINNINKGKATILVTGKGTAAAGSKTAKFTIRAKNMGKFN